MIIQLRRFSFFLLVLLIGLLNSPLLWADCLDIYHGESHAGGALNIAFRFEKAELESTDNYLSGPAGTEEWKARHDVDGNLYGVSIRFEPSIWNKRVRFDAKVLTGELDGSFKTQEVSPTPEGPYSGSVEFDRDEWELGVDVYILNAVYARLQYSGFTMDGDWEYSGGFPDEPQEYKYDAYTAGLGFRRLYRSHKQSKFGLGVHAFAGLTFFEYEHTEKTVDAKVEFDDIGHELSAELIGTYDLPIGEKAMVFLGLGYTYVSTDDDDLDLTQEAITSRLGIRVAF